MKFNSVGRPSIDACREATKTFSFFCTAILFEFPREVDSVKNRIVRNLIARTGKLVSGLFALWDSEDYHDCWILHRCLVDRYLHLFHLVSADEFEKFEAWSFLYQYQHILAVRAEPGFDDANDGPLFPITAEKKKRGSELQKQPSLKWVRPKAREVAERCGMPFLYRYGYDYASAYIHPMATDGSEDFFRLTKFTTDEPLIDHDTVLYNSLLVATMIVQDGMNACGFSWKPLMYQFLEDFRSFIASGNEVYKSRFASIAEIFPERLAEEKRPPQPPTNGLP